MNIKFISITKFQRDLQLWMSPLDPPLTLEG